jgi:hypothetical protein
MPFVLNKDFKYFKASTLVVDIYNKLIDLINLKLLNKNLSV